MSLNQNPSNMWKNHKQHKLIEADEYFYSLVHTTPEIKRRKCLKCGQEFKSYRGNRLCGPCNLKNERIRSPYALEDRA